MRSLQDIRDDLGGVYFSQRWTTDVSANAGAVIVPGSLKDMALDGGIFDLAKGWVMEAELTSQARSEGTLLLESGGHGGCRRCTTR